MKRIFTILLVITILTAMMIPVHSFGAAAGTPTVELTKTTYKVGEDIVGSYADYTSNYWGRSRADIVIYKKGDVVGQSSNLGGYSVYNSDANKSQSGASSGTFTFPKDDDVRNKANFPLAEGEYFICLRADNSIVGEPVTFYVSNSVPPSLELTKDTYKEGEDIVGSYANFTEDYWGNSRGDIVIYKKGHVVGKDSNLGGYSVWNANSNTSQSGLTSGTFTFPKDDDVRNKQNFPLPVGEYFICLRADNSVVGEAVYFKVVAANPPVLTLSKTTYKVGEDIVGTYEHFTEDLWGGERADIVVYKKGDVVGQASNLGGYSVYNKDANKSQSGQASGTFTLPADDDVRNQANFPLEPGEYFICLRADQTIVGEVVNFTVEAENTQTGDGTLWGFAIISVLGICAFVMVKKRQNVY